MIAFGSVIPQPGTCFISRIPSHLIEKRKRHEQPGPCRKDIQQPRSSENSRTAERYPARRAISWPLYVRPAPQFCDSWHHVDARSMERGTDSIGNCLSNRWVSRPATGAVGRKSCAAAAEPADVFWPANTDRP